ncbi:MAG: hypothetical protein QOF76_1511 [Solirubrobacteraceae bacterium]|jgi:glucose/arabinose dehydrogenase|nr:hypothetical protein [Solirubrobacteraceae bacterium]
MRYAAAVLLTLGLLGCGGGAGSGDTTTSNQEPTTTADISGATATATAKRGLKLARVGTYNAPVYLTTPPGDASHRYVVEQAGTVRLVGAKTPFLDIRSRVVAGSEQGLLSIAFAPDYATSKRFYAYFTNRDQKEEIDQFTAASAGHADASSAKRVMVMDDPESNHNGGLLLFGPDRHMYVGTGDGGGAGDAHGPRGNAQNLGSPLGKILRIDPKPDGGYTIPADNPFAGQSGKRGEIYSYGLRNPWRYSFDRKTGDLIIGDVGQNMYEEIDFVRKGNGRGANFGWRPFEGLHVYASGESAPGAIKPVIEQSHADGNCSITGGVVVRDRSVPGAYGDYLFGDYCKGEVYRARLSPGKATGVKQTGLKVGGLASFGQDAAGHVYLISNNGPVYRLEAGR